MVYSNKFVMCVIVDGTIQKELANGVVKMPFSSEYVLRFRNKHNRRAAVQIYIDGENVSGAGYIVPANDFVDIKRHHDKDRSFKFVSLDSEEAHDFGKNGPNEDKVKGTIEARFYLEKEPPKEVHHHHHHDHYYPRPDPWYPTWPWDRKITWSNNAQADSGKARTCGIQGSSSMLRGMQLCSAKPDTELQDGCTVEGNYTGQHFNSVSVDLEDTYTTLKIFLQGFEDKSVESVRKTNKQQQIEDLQAENERLKEELAKRENRRLKKKIKELEA